MANLLQNGIQAAKNFYGTVTRGDLIDPDNVDSEFSPKDLKAAPPVPPEDERDIVTLVTDRYKDASTVKAIHVRDWLICQAYRMGNHWLEWRANELTDLRDPNDNLRAYTTVDQIDRLLKKLKARATMSKPDASVKPLTNSDLDRLASDEARDVLAHYDSKFNRQEQSLEWVDSVLSTSTTFLKIIWDSSARVLAPTPDGKSEYQALGDLDEIVVPPFELYPDPAARDWSEVTWLIHAKDRPLSYIQARYGERGKRVEGKVAKGDANFNWADNRLDLISGDSIPANHSSNKVATVLECWELPSLRYPKGRLIRVAGNVLLTDPDKLDWPYKKNDTFPFVPLAYEKRPRGLWSLNAVGRLVKPQKAFNTVISRIEDRVNNDKIIILEPQGAETGVDEIYDSPKSIKRVKHKQGFEPQLFQPSPMNESLVAWANFLIAQMENISGVHEVSNGTVPAGVTAGNAIELLQQSDQTQMAEFITCIETSQKLRAEWEVALVSQFYSEPRLLAVSQLPMSTPPAHSAAPPPQMPATGPQGPMQPPTGGAGPQMPMPGGAPSLPPSPPPGMGAPTPSPPGQQPATAAMAVRAFEGLTQGGMVHIEIVPGSATPKTPAARSQQIMDLWHAGAFTPQGLPVTKIVADELGFQRSDTFTDRIDEAYAQIQANNPDPGAVAQQQMQADQQAQMDKQAHDGAILAATTHAEIEKINAKADADIRVNDAKILAQSHADAVQSLQDHAESTAEQTAGHHHDAATQHVDSTLIPLSASISLPGATPTATSEILKDYNIDAGSPEEIAKSSAAAMAEKQQATAVKTTQMKGDQSAELAKQQAAQKPKESKP